MEVSVSVSPDRHRLGYTASPFIIINITLITTIMMREVVGMVVVGDKIIFRELLSISIHCQDKRKRGIQIMIKYYKWLQSGACD